MPDEEITVPLSVFKLLRESLEDRGCEHWPVHGPLCLCQWVDVIILQHTVDRLAGIRRQGDTDD